MYHTTTHIPPYHNIVFPSADGWLSLTLVFVSLRKKLADSTFHLRPVAQTQRVGVPYVLFLGSLPANSEVSSHHGIE